MHVASSVQEVFHNRRVFSAEGKAGVGRSHQGYSEAVGCPRTLSERQETGPSQEHLARRYCSQSGSKAHLLKTDLLGAPLPWSPALLWFSISGWWLIPLPSGSGRQHCAEESITGCSGRGSELGVIYPLRTVQGRTSTIFLGPIKFSEFLLNSEAKNKL